MARDPFGRKSRFAGLGYGEEMHSHAFRCGCETDCDDPDCIRPARLEYRCRFHARIALTISDAPILRMVR